MKFTYLLVELVAVFIPFLFSFHPSLQFYKVWFAFLPAMIVTAIFFIAWDFLFTSMGVWGFNPDYITGLKILNLPLEEILFFLFIPYSCMFTYHCLKLILKHDVLWRYRKIINSALIILLVVIGFVNYQMLYTFSTALLLALAIFIFRKAHFIARFYFAYLILLIPFIIVNGILTGLWIPGEVVWYNNKETMGIRLLTIPVEDIFYGMLLLLLNTAGMEFLLTLRTKHE